MNLENIKLHKNTLNIFFTLISRLKTYEAHAALITVLDGEVRRYPGNIFLDKEEKELIFIIISKKGYFVGAKAAHRDRGKYMTIPKIIEILEENPDWIRIKKVSNKFGL
jgi:hypothetical protein